MKVQDMALNKKLIVQVMAACSGCELLAGARYGYGEGKVKTNKRR